MQRRQFLQGAGTLGAAVLLPAAAHAAAEAFAAPAQNRFTLLRAAAAIAGTAYQRFEVSACEACSTDAVRVRLDGLHVATGSRLRALALSALFDHPDGGTAPFLAWHYADDGAVRMSQRASFVAGRASMRGFELEYRHRGEAACRTQACALTRFEAPLLSPGHYVLVDAPAPATLVHGGDALAPLGARDFDYFAFRIEPLA